MSSLDDIAEILQGQPRKPPIEKWHPQFSGDIDIHIDARGDWYHEGTQIKRQSLVNLFASILRRELDDCYYLVTPVEKWRIRVDDTPLLAVDMDFVGQGDQQKIVFRLNTDELVVLGGQRVLRIEHADHEPRPILDLEHGLTARLTSALFYRLVDLAERRGNELGVANNGHWVPIATLSN